MKRILCGLTAALLLPLAQAAEYDIQVENVTRGIYFTPLLVAAHAPNVQLFTPGEAASASLQAMAEGGDIAALETDLTAAGATISANPAGGLLAPGETTTATLNTDNATANTRLSVVAMLLPTNDGFVGLNNLVLPTEPAPTTTMLRVGTPAAKAMTRFAAAGFPARPASRFHRRWILLLAATVPARVRLPKAMSTYIAATWETPRVMAASAISTAPCTAG